MKLRIFPFEHEIIFDEDHIQVLEIEDRRLFSRVCQSVNLMVAKEDGLEKMFLFEGEKILPFTGNVYFVSDLFSTTISERSMERPLFKEIEESLVLDYEVREKLILALNQCAGMVGNVLNEFDFDVSYDREVELPKFYKAMNIKVAFDILQSPAERIYQLIDVLSSFKKARVMAFANLKAYLEEEEIEKIYQYSLYKKIYLLLIESRPAEKQLMYEKKWLIDQDFDEQVLE